MADIDLKEVVIRRLAGSLEATVENFIAAVPYVSVAAGVNRKSIPIDIFGEFTYLARTRDTSGNFSDDVAAITITTSRPSRSKVVAAFNEDSPAVNFTDITNNNSSENNFPSFADSTKNGLDIAGGSAVDRANGTSEGFSAVAGAATDLLADDTATYITQIRDYGQSVTGSVFIDIEGTQSIQTTWNDLHNHLFQSVTEEAPASVQDSSLGGIGHILGFSNTMPIDFRYDSNNETMMSGGQFGNVYAIHLHGNFTNDESNANVTALIAGAINADAIALGETFLQTENLLVVMFWLTFLLRTSYQLVDLNQYGDPGGLGTYVGSLGSLTTQTFIRTSTETSPFFTANSNANTKPLLDSL